MKYFVHMRGSAPTPRAISTILPTMPLPLRGSCLRRHDVKQASGTVGSTFADQGCRRIQHLLQGRHPTAKQGLTTTSTFLEESHE